MRLCYVVDVIAVPGGVLTSRWFRKLPRADAAACQLSESVERTVVPVYAMPGGHFLKAWRAGELVPANENVLYQIRGQGHYADYMPGLARHASQELERAPLAHVAPGSLHKARGDVPVAVTS